MEYLLLAVIVLYAITMVVNFIIWCVTIFEVFKNPNIHITIGDIVFMLLTLIMLISPIGVFFVWYALIDSIMKIRIK